MLPVQNLLQSRSSRGGSRKREKIICFTIEIEIVTGQAATGHHDLSAEQRCEKPSLVLHVRMPKHPTKEEAFQLQTKINGCKGLPVKEKAAFLLFHKILLLPNIEAGLRSFTSTVRETLFTENR